MCLRAVKVGRQCARLRIALLVGTFDFENARRTGTDEYTDASDTVACLGGFNAFDKTALYEAGLGEPVVVVIEIGQACACGCGVGARHFADPCAGIGVREDTRREVAPLPAQRVEHGVKAMSGVACGGEMCEQDGFHWGRCCDNCGVGRIRQVVAPIANKFYQMVVYERVACMDSGARAARNVVYHNYAYAAVSSTFGNTVSRTGSPCAPRAAWPSQSSRMSYGVKPYSRR